MNNTKQRQGLSITSANLYTSGNDNDGSIFNDCRSTNVAYCLSHHYMAGITWLGTRIIVSLARRLGFSANWNARFDDSFMGQIFRHQHIAGLCSKPLYYFMPDLGRCTGELPSSSSLERGKSFPPLGYHTDDSRESLLKAARSL